MQRLDWLMRAGHSVVFLTAVAALWLAGIGGAQAAPGIGSPSPSAQASGSATATGTPSVRAAAASDPLVFSGLRVSCTVAAETVFAQTVRNTDTVAHTAGMGAVGYNGDGAESPPVPAPTVTVVVAPGASTTLTLTQSIRNEWASVEDFDSAVSLGSPLTGDPSLPCSPTKTSEFDALSGVETDDAVGCYDHDQLLEVIAAPQHGTATSAGPDGTPPGPYVSYRSTPGFVGTDHFDVLCKGFPFAPFAVRVTVDVAAAPVTTHPAPTPSSAAPQSSHPASTPAAPAAAETLPKTGTSSVTDLTLGLGLVAAGAIALLLSRSRKHRRQQP